MVASGDKKRRKLRWAYPKGTRLSVDVDEDGRPVLTVLYPPGFDDKVRPIRLDEEARQGS